MTLESIPANPADKYSEYCLLYIHALFTQYTPGKNPISALQEICAKKHWITPQYDLVMCGGPPHMKTFLFQVRVRQLLSLPDIIGLLFF